MVLIAEAARGFPAWHEAAGEHRLFGGNTPIRDCEAHFHETYIIAYIKRGRARARIDGETVLLTRGVALLVNPYEVIDCVSEADFDYDVCYPDSAFMREAMVRAAGRAEAPRFVRPGWQGEVAGKIGVLLGAFCPAQGHVETGLVERDMLRLFAEHPELLSAGLATVRRPDDVVKACELIERLIEEPITIADISARLRCSRSHLARAFRGSIGLAPNIYIRQLRLARALERVRAGEPLADVAMLYGFFDQAHFTREFKRVYGTPPGRLARDITRCRHCG